MESKREQKASLIERIIKEINKDLMVLYREYDKKKKKLKKKAEGERKKLK